MESNTETIAGIFSSDDIEYAVGHIHGGHFGRALESHHVKTSQLLRFIAANHPLIDGNKRTALMSTQIFYALNGCRFGYDREIKEILRTLATNENSVEVDDMITYLRAHAEPFAPECETAINLWLTRVEGTDQLPAEHDTIEQDTYEPSDYDDGAHNGE